ncbi:MAG: hypothetical protein JWO97_3644 [Acidobacteria bacterium]|nr:hypothetical protein [Acidobacteriota bacterium]
MKPLVVAMFAFAIGASAVAQIITLPPCPGVWDGHNHVSLGRAINGNLLSNGTVMYLDLSTDQPSTSAALNADHYIHPDGAMYNALASGGVNVVLPAEYAGTVSMTPFAGCFRARIEAEVYATGCHSAQGWGSGATCIDKTAEISLYCPLILDLNGDGIHTTRLATSPVSFWDRNFDGIADPSGWTDPDTEEAFLWMDGDDDRAVLPGELFGSAMFKPSGGFFANGFQALEQYDTPEFGGNGDREITAADAVWPRLRLWIDRNHDGHSHPNEISRLESHQIVSLKLDRVHDHSLDANGNGVMLVGSYVRRHGGVLEEHAMDDISFARP